MEEIILCQPINKNSNYCVFENCLKRASFNFQGLKPSFCKLHTEKGMINVRDKKCEYSGCKTIPNYNYNEEKNARFCKLHKLDGMVDIKNKKCKSEKCKIIPIYNYEGEKTPMFCNLHKLTGMINIKDKKCKYNNCKTIPTFNYN